MPNATTDTPTATDAAAAISNALTELDVLADALLAGRLASIEPLRHALLAAHAAAIRQADELDAAERDAWLVAGAAGLDRALAAVGAAREPAR
jgi:hypothetical protein